MKKKILTGLLCALVIGPLAACDNGNTSDDGTGAGGAGGGNTATEVKVQEKLTDAAQATSKKLVEGLEKDIFAVKYDLEAEMAVDMKMSLVDYVVNENYELEETGRTSLGTATMSATEDISFVGNLDLKYYNALMSQAETLPENATEFYIGVDMTNTESMGVMKEETSSKIGFYMNADEMFIQNDEDKASQPVEEDIHYTVAAVLAELKKVTEYDFDQILDYALQLIGGSMSEEGTDIAPEIEGYKAIINTVLGFIEGTVTSEELFDLLTPLMSAPGEEIDPQVKTLVVSMLDYVKAINLHSLLDFSSKGDVITIKFNYKAFKTLLNKVIDDVANLISTSGMEGAAEVAQQISAVKPMINEVLPKTVNFKITLGLKGGLIVSNSMDLLVEADIPMSSSVGYPGEVGATTQGQEMSLTKIDASYDMTFDFGSTAYEVPVITIA